MQRICCAGRGTGSRGFAKLRHTDTWKLPGAGAGANHLTALEEMARGSLSLELPWASFIGDYDAGGRRCRVFGYSLPAGDAVATTGAAWFTRGEIEDLAARGRLSGGFEADAVARWVDPSFLRGVGQSKEQALRDDAGVTA